MGNEYAWGSSDQERQRLASQGDLLRPATERLFRAAGIGPGARVLDCGSGGGDVSIIAAELVTPSGQVLGIDRDATQVEAATRRVKELGLHHVRFETADLSSPPDGPFDAIVGRLVLMYQPDVATVLRTLGDRLAPSGVVAFMGANEVLVSSTLRDLVIGSGLEFEERGAHQLKGVPGDVDAGRPNTSPFASVIR